MASSYPLLSKFINSFFSTRIQSDLITKALNALLANKNIKNSIPDLHTVKNASLTPKKVQKSTQTHSNILSSKPIDVGSANYIISNKYMDSFEKDPDTEIFIICLNRSFNLDTLRSMHNISSYTILADGAANYFHDILKKNSFKDDIIPHAIVGDFDSIRQDVLDHYRQKDVHIYQDPSQDDTDLEKCLRHLEKKIHSNPISERARFHRVIITGGFGGRVDHTLNNIHVLHKFAEKYMYEEHISLHLIDNNSIGTCILPGKTQYIRSKTFENPKGCGLFPLLGEQAKVCTKGLKWNLGNETPELSFKHFVSSSNEMVDDVIEIETDKIIFWTTTNRIHKEEDED
jgi:thiamine pyrophosphokinase